MPMMPMLAGSGSNAGTVKFANVSTIPAEVLSWLENCPVLVFELVETILMSPKSRLEEPDETVDVPVQV
jgi:hypothetical protein